MPYFIPIKTDVFKFTGTAAREEQKYNFKFSKDLCDNLWKQFFWVVYMKADQTLQS